MKWGGKGCWGHSTALLSFNLLPPHSHKEESNSNSLDMPRVDLWKRCFPGLCGSWPSLAEASREQASAATWPFPKEGEMEKLDQGKPSWNPWKPRMPSGVWFKALIGLWTPVKTAICQRCVLQVGSRKFCLGSRGWLGSLDLRHVVGVLRLWLPGPTLLPRRTRTGLPQNCCSWQFLQRHPSIALNDSGCKTGVMHFNFPSTKLQGE